MASCPKVSAHTSALPNAPLRRPHWVHEASPLSLSSAGLSTPYLRPSGFLPVPHPRPSSHCPSFRVWVQLSPTLRCLCEAEITQSLRRTPIVLASPIRSNPYPAARAPNSPLPATHLHIAGLARVQPSTWKPRASHPRSPPHLSTLLSPGPV